jgi:hypothetical protein
MPREIEDLRAAVETWATMRHQFTSFTRTDMQRFVETMNYHTRKTISILNSQDPEFWSALMELAQNASTLVTKGAKIFVDGEDRTNT